jgi:hypothetical protein
VTSPVLVWVKYSLDWISDRHAEMPYDWLKQYGPNLPMSSGRVRAPAALWLFGERGVDRIWWDDRYRHHRARDSEDIRRLFPEAEIIYVTPPGKRAAG